MSDLPLSEQPTAPLPCPFCGKELRLSAPRRRIWKHPVDVTCILGAFTQIDQSTIAAWNRRRSDSPTAEKARNASCPCMGPKNIHPRGAIGCRHEDEPRLPNDIDVKDVAWKAAREGFLRGNESADIGTGFEHACAAAESFARKYVDARWPSPSSEPRS